MTVYPGGFVADQNPPETSSAPSLACFEPTDPTVLADQTGHVVDALKSSAIGFVNLVHHRLSTQTEKPADRRRFPSRQKQQQSRDANPDPRAGNRVCHPQ
jgi:hypothetical protein